MCDTQCVSSALVQYDAVARRENGRAAKAASRANARPARAPVAATAAVARKRAPVAAAKPAAPREAERKTRPLTAGRVPSRTASAPGTAAAQRKVLALENEVTELQQTVEALERERDFYFAKLRSVEILCQEHEGDDEIVKAVLERLYAEDEEPEEVEQV